MQKRKNKMKGKRRKLWEFLLAYHEEHGYAASRAECAQALNVSQGNIDYYLDKLAKDQWIAVTPRVQRGIKILRGGVPAVDAETGEGLDQDDPYRPRIDGVEALLGERPDLFVRVGNDAMTGAGVGQGDWMALVQNRAPEHGDLVAAEIGGNVEVRRFVQTHAGDMLGSEPERWTGYESSWVRANAENVTVLGVEIASTTTAKGRRRREQRKAQAMMRREAAMGREAQPAQARERGGRGGRGRGM